MAKEYSMKDIEKRLGYSAPWVRKFESLGLLRFEARKGRGRKARYYSESELQTIWHIAALRQIGVPLETLKESVEKGKRIKHLANKYQTKDGKGDLVFAVFIHNPKDSIGLDGNVRIFWHRVPENHAKEIKELLVWFMRKTEHVIDLAERYIRGFDSMKLLVENLKGTLLPKMREHLNKIP
jgi:DNA-binding transcriptional MerR regulator